MVCAYITEVFGCVLRHENEMAAESLEYGNGCWWNSKKMLAHLRKVLTISIIIAFGSAWCVMFTISCCVSWFCIEGD
jgi:hypothetical protein